MKKWLRFLLPIGLISFMTTTYVSGGMTIFLEDGRMIDVDVDREDVISISFGKSAQPAADITWNFETGDLRGWEMTGEAFKTQPTYGDNPKARDGTKSSGHQGSYWIGGYENRHRSSDRAGTIQGDGPRGTLTSEPFTVTKPTISFLVGGGCSTHERVELLIDSEVVLNATGECRETMQRLTWDVSAYTGRSVRIRLVDASDGHWGHINFDDVRFE